MLAIIRSYIAIVLWLLSVLFGLRWKIVGDRCDAHGPVLVASKHQSSFEALILQYELRDPVIVLKRELLSVPLFGWVLRRLGHIGVDRAGDLKDTLELLRAARAAMLEGRPVLIFPEGSRRSMDAPPDYKAGTGLLYSVLKVVCVPIAVNSGRVWPASAWTPASGNIVVQFLPPIEPGLSRVCFGKILESVIEEATARLTQFPASVN